VLEIVDRGRCASGWLDGSQPLKFAHPSDDFFGRPHGGGKTITTESIVQAERDYFLFVSVLYSQVHLGIELLEGKVNLGLQPSAVSLFSWSMESQTLAVIMGFFQKAPKKTRLVQWVVGEASDGLEAVRKVEE